MVKPEEFLNRIMHLDFSQFLEDPEALMVPAIRNVQPLQPVIVRGELM
jgi:hypothetical protein